MRDSIQIKAASLLITSSVQGVEGIRIKSWNRLGRWFFVVVCFVCFCFFVLFSFFFSFFLLSMFCRLFFNAELRLAELDVQDAIRCHCWKLEWKTCMQLEASPATIKVLFFRGCRIVIPWSMREDILVKIHDGRLGITKCRERANSLVRWPGTKENVKKTVLTCRYCEENEPS